MTRRNSSVNKTLEDPDSNIIRKNPAALPSSLFFGISGRNTIARDHLTAIPRLCRLAVFLCRIGADLTPEGFWPTKVGISTYTFTTRSE
jgi:hypothetical protein